MATDSVEGSQREQQLDEILGAFLEALERGEAPDQQALLERHPEFAAELSAFFANEAQFCKRASLPHPLLPHVIDALPSGPDLSVVSPEDFLSDSASAPPPSPGSKPRLAPEPASEAVAEQNPASVPDASGVLPPLIPIDRNFGDFELLEFLGRGGMGIVFKARQISLRRLVAVKMIVAGPFATPEDVARFQKEAESAARLDHRHIVPIYTVGQHKGIHYFSMRLLEKETVAARLQKYKADRRAAVALLAAVAGAVHHAHQHGILHRDLKPSNILLDPAGQPLVADFGLAKRCEAGPEDVTLSGELHGTAAYMAPEQATGNKTEITTGTDVHGLGLILYALLTGDTPFRAESLLPTLELVKYRTPPAPLPATNGATRDLNTICLKCLEKDPKQRYGSAQELADELNRWLAGEPIVARPIGPASRFWRLCRRHPLVASLSTTAAVLLVVAVGALAFSNAAILSAKLRAEGAYQRSRAISEDYRNVIDRMYTRVAEERLFDQPHMEELQRDLLLEAQRAYQRMIEEGDPDRANRREVALAHLRVGEIQLLLGQNAEAEVAARKAVGRFLALADERPLLEPPKRDLAKAQRLLGRVLAASHRAQAAETALRSALAIEQALVAAAPTNTAYRLGLAQTLANLARLIETAGRTREAEEAYRRALEHYDKLVQTAPAETDYLHQQGGTLNNLALLLQAEGKLEEARSMLEQAIEKQNHAYKTHRGHPGYRHFLGNHNANRAEILAQMGLISQAQAAYETVISLHEELAAEHHAVPTYRKLVAADYRNVGRLLEEAGQLDAAEQAYKKARALGQELVNDFPGSDACQELAGTLLSLGRLLQNLGRHGEADNAIREAVALGKRLVASDSGSPRYQLSLGAGLLTHGLLLQAEGRGEQAERDYGEALKLLVPLSSTFPSQPDFRHALASSHLSTGSLLFAAGKLKEAEQSHQAALGALEKLTADVPDRPGYRHDLARVHADLGDVYLASGRAADAENAYTKALGLQQDLVSAVRDVPHYHYDLAQTFCKLGRLAGPGVKRAQREAHLREGIDLLEELVDRVPQVGPYRQALAAAYLQLGLAQFEQKRYDEAESSLRQAVELAMPLLDASPPRPDDRSLLAAAFDARAAVLGSRYREALGQAQADRDPADLERARQFSEQAITHQAIALQAYPHNPTFRDHMITQYANLARTLLLEHRHTEVAARAAELAAALPDDASALSSAARMVCASLAPLENELPTDFDRREDVVRAAIEQAAGYLRQAEDMLGTQPASNLAQARTPARARLADACNSLAWFLATCQRSALRDPNRAAVLASKACELAPDVPRIRATLGLACYRKGEWSAAAENLQRALGPRRDFDPADGFALAMSHWRLQRTDDARRWLQKSNARMQSTRDPDQALQRLKAEAELLITQPAPAGNEVEP